MPPPMDVTPSQQCTAMAAEKYLAFVAKSFVCLLAPQCPKQSKFHASLSMVLSQFVLKFSFPGCLCQYHKGNKPDLFSGSHHRTTDEYTNRIPNPEGIPKYTKVKVLSTQDNTTSAEQLGRAMLPLPLAYKNPCHY